MSIACASPMQASCSRSRRAWMNGESRSSNYTTKKGCEAMVPTKILRQAEARLRVTKRDVATMPVKNVQELVHELQVHQIELEMQNEELRRTQMELEAARDSYVDLYDFSLAGHLTLDRRGTIVEANLRAEIGRAS